MDELEAIRARKLASLQAQAKAEGGGPVVLSDETFGPKVQESRILLVDFWADWCGPCHAVAPSVEAVAREYAGRVTVGKLNVDENPRTAQQFGVQSIPTILLFKDGKLVDGVIGAVPKRQLVELVQRWL